MKKKKILSLLSVMLLASILLSIPVNAAEIQTYAWPGRPGGNGDGSEEWLQGEYGQAGSKSVLYRHETGVTEDLNTKNANAKSVCSFLLNGLVAATNPAIAPYVSISSFLDSITNKGYEGAYYVLDAYWSGRQSKIVIKTYRDEGHTKYVKTYTEYVKW